MYPKEEKKVVKKEEKKVVKKDTVDWEKVHKLVDGGMDQEDAIREARI